MSRELLRLIDEVRAFNPTPTLNDLGDLHVPFESMVPGNSVESLLVKCARRGDRIALIADSGCGKSSLVSYALGPTVEKVAPILVPVYRLEDDAKRAESVADAIISHLRREASIESSSKQLTGSVEGDERSVTHSVAQSGEASLGLMSWLGGKLSRELSQQTSTTESIPLAEKIEVIQQCLYTIRVDKLMPVLVFDDTDRWTGPDETARVRGFYGEGIRWLTELETSVVVATHKHYLSSIAPSKDMLKFLETEVRLPILPSSNEVAQILQHRLTLHGAELDETWELSDAFDPSAIDELFADYQQDTDLRQLLLCAHRALVEAADAGREIVTRSEIRAASHA